MASEHWSQVQLADLIDIRHGFAFDGQYFRDEPPGDILLTPGNFAIGGGFQDGKLKYYDGPVPSGFVLAQNDLLVTMTDLSKNGDTLGYPAFVPVSQGEVRYLHNQRLGKVTIREGAPLDIRYLYYLLRTREYRTEVLSSATGSTVRHTSPDRIRAFRFNLPPLPEQHAIARILGSLDDKVELNRRMNDTLEAIAHTLFQSWFVDFDPVRAKAQGRQPASMDAETAALFPNSFEESALGLIPQGWQIGNLGDLADVTMGQSPPGETYNEAGEGLPFYQGTRDFGARFPARRVYCTLPTRYADAEDILFSVRAPVGTINIALERSAIGRGVAALRQKQEPHGFLLYLLQSMPDQWERFEASGTVFGSITKSDILQLQVILPPQHVITAFGRLVGPIDARYRSNELESRTLAATRDTLLPKLLSGEVRVA
jgi:type I restriction enzyme, S subunit